MNDLAGMCVLRCRDGPGDEQSLQIVERLIWQTEMAGPRATISAVRFDIDVRKVLPV